MKLKRIQLTQLQIPFRTSFKHSSAERSITETVIAVAQSPDSMHGYGEGCPREYVTGESIESCVQFAERNLNQILCIENIEKLQLWVSNNSILIDQNPAAWCAIETALMDLFGKEEVKTIESLLGIPEIQGSFCFSAVLGASAPKVFEAQFSQYHNLGIQEYKVKISGDCEIDRQNVKLILSYLPEARIRLDANNLWQDAVEATQYISSLGCNFWAVEEPLRVGDYSSCKQVAKSLGCKIILDESFLRAGHLVHIQNEPDLWIPNIRVSKMGGLIRSLVIAERCKNMGLKFVVGAQVGETSLLTRLALSLANSYRNILLAQEGAFGTYLLAHDVTDSPIMFGKGGILEAPPRVSYGLGVNYNL